MHYIATVLKISTLSIALLGSTAVATVLVSTDAAYAGKGNGNSGDKGGGNGNSGNAGNSDKGGKSTATRGNSGQSKGGAAKDRTSRGKLSLRGLFGGSDDAGTTRTSRSKTERKAATAQAPVKAKAPAAKPRGNRLAATLGVHPSELGALNAANASPNALKNASPNSRVGKLALYADEVRATEILRDDLEQAQAELEFIEEPSRSDDEIVAAIDAANGDKAALEAELATLESDLSAAGGDDADIQAEIDRVQQSIGDKDSELVALEQERVDGQAYAAAEDEVERLQQELDGQAENQRAALEAAANKEVTDEIEHAVQAMLGLLDEDPDAVDEDAGIIEDETASLE